MNESRSYDICLLSLSHRDKTNWKCGHVPYAKSLILYLFFGHIITLLMGVAHIIICV